MIIPNKLYDILKYVARIGLPALATFWFAIGTIWELPNVDKVIGTMTAIDTLLATLLQISNINYNRRNK